mmetsp:Transcript_4366/g.10388  ORF Transcript_4366/g.10388 Transcript_4366/m.10388 type:complete len:202 (-) Transcript_4366:290-895(-)
MGVLDRGGRYEPLLCTVPCVSRNTGSTQTAIATVIKPSCKDLGDAIPEPDSHVLFFVRAAELDLLAILEVHTVSYGQLRILPIDIAGPDRHNHPECGCATRTLCGSALGEQQATLGLPLRFIQTYKGPAPWCGEVCSLELERREGCILGVHHTPPSSYPDRGDSSICTFPPDLAGTDGHDVALARPPPAGQHDATLRGLLG